ncbi:MAG: citrate transporter [Clostridia bacterium]|nr:citrate transporter [Clostridia bacterium]
MSRVVLFFKREVVLVVSMILALGSMIFVVPDKAYAGYIDWHTLGLLFCLMAVMAGLQKMGAFRMVGDWMLGKVHDSWQLVWILVFLPFFFSMVITNDVALITFVPFGIVVLKICQKEKLVIPVVVMQTLAANMGSSLTPVGNPQNLYLYSQSKIGVGSFLVLMLPYTVLTGAVLFAAVFFFKREKIYGFCETSDHANGRKKSEDIISKKDLLLYAVLFGICLMGVAKILPTPIIVLLVAGSLLIRDREILCRIDYALLGTFVGFFVFVGNMARIEFFRMFLEKMIVGHEELAGILSSQVISNVPAALLLSGFTQKWECLIVGTNLGGLGTLIASMASLISYKQIVSVYPGIQGKYLICFTVGNILLLALLMAAATIIP